MYSEPFDLDKVSLECFTNQHQYKKYLAKKNSVTNTHEKQYGLHGRAVSKAGPLLKLFEELIHNTSYHILDSKFIPFAEACLDHLEKTERQQQYTEEAAAVLDLMDTPVPPIPIEYWKMHNISKEEEKKKM